MGTPVYKTITDDILKAIDSGRLKPGDRIASIRELCDQYNVSQITVLRVFKELVQADRIVRHEGTGYFVKDAEKMDRSGDSSEDLELVFTAQNILNHRLLSLW